MSKSILEENKESIELKDIKFKFKTIREDDNSYTLSLEDIDVVVNAANFDEALDLLVSDFKEYCLEYYENIDLWKAAPNRKEHFKYVIKALNYKTVEELKKNFIDTNLAPMKF